MAKKSSENYYNERLEEILGHGRFQYFIIFTFVSVISVVGAWDLLQLVFSIGDGQYRCSLPPEMENRLQDGGIVVSEEFVGKCEMSKFRPNCSESTHAGQIFGPDCFDVEEKVACSGAYGYVHMRNYSGEFWSLKSEKSWVCDSDHYAATIFSATSVGRILWLIITMPIIDSWGRKPFVYGLCTIAIVFRILAFLLSDYYWAMVVCLAISAPNGTSVRVALTLVSEYCNAFGRTLGYIVCWVAWVLGACVLPLVAWQCQEWFSYGLAVPLSLLVVLPFYWLTPESPRLLLTLGKVEEAEKIIRKIKRFNKDEIPEDLHDELVAISRAISSPKKSKLKSIMRSRRLTFTLLMCALVWMVNELMYGAGLLNSGSFAGNQYVNFALMSLTELPASFVGNFMINRFGRRWSNVACMLGNMLMQAGIMVAIAAEDGNMGGAVTALAITGRVFSNISWYIMWVQTVECFSTDVRGGCTSILGLCGSVAGVAVPYLTMLGIENPLVMYGLMTAIGAVGTLACSLLPETNNQPLLECVEDFDHVKQHPFWSFNVWKESSEESSPEEMETFARQQIEEVDKRH